MAIQFLEVLFQILMVWSSEVDIYETGFICVSEGEGLGGKRIQSTAFHDETERCGYSLNDHAE